MNDENLGKCADHGGDWGLSCGFWAKYPSLADAHIRRVHLKDPTPLEVLSRYRLEDKDLYLNPGGGGITDDFNPEDFHPDPVVAELRKRPMYISEACHIFAGIAIYIVLVAVCALALVMFAWLVQSLWAYFGG